MITPFMMPKRDASSFILRIPTVEGSVDSVSFGDRSLRHEDEKQSFELSSAIDYFLQAVEGVARARFSNVIDANRRFLGGSGRLCQCGMLC